MENKINKEGLFKCVEKIEKKNNKESILFRHDGNSYYQQMKIFDAILAYNKAIVFAETEEDLALAYGNRSAAYFEANKYEECLKSIKLAKETGFPSKKIKQLIEREEKCKKLMELKKEDPENDLWNFIKLSYPANEKIPWLVEGLEVRKTKKFGRGIYATRDLKIGDIICIEETKLQAVDFDGFFKCCNNCAKTNMMNLIPCLKTASFMFCSTDCRDEFYKYADLNSDMFNKDAFFLNKMKDIFGGRENLLQYINQNPSNSVFDFDFSDSNHPEFWLNIYKCLLSSKSLPLIFDGVETEDIDPIEKKLRRLFNEKFLSNAVVVIHRKHENEIMPKNQIPIGNFEKAEYQAEKPCFSTFRALLNHSCISNIDFICIDNTVVFFAKMPIKKNEQLFIAYGDLNMKNHSEILSFFGVRNCSCYACVHNLSVFDKKYENVENFNRASKILFHSGEIFSVSFGMKLILTLFDVLNNCKKPISCERFLCGIYIKKIFNILADHLTFPA